MEEQMTGGGRREPGGRAGRALVLLLPFVAGACALPGRATLEVSPKTALTGPRVIAVMGTRNAVVAALEDALAEKGFTFAHYVSRDRAAVPAGGVRSGAGTMDNTKYAIEVIPEIYEGCAGGGFKLTSLRVSVVDRSSNELMLRSTAKGRTEKCPPASGTIFHDIAGAIDAAWQK